LATWRNRAENQTSESRGMVINGYPTALVNDVVPISLDTRGFERRHSLGRAADKYGSFRVKTSLSGDGLHGRKPEACDIKDSPGRSGRCRNRSVP
ncbi:hypothetical protein RvY_08909, partial [Ramazzottius varieornatus]